MCQGAVILMTYIAAHQLAAYVINGNAICRRLVETEGMRWRKGLTEQKKRGPRSLLGV